MPEPSTDASGSVLWKTNNNPIVKLYMHKVATALSFMTNV